MKRFNKKIVLILVASLILSGFLFMGPPGIGGAMSGNGSSGDPYQITTPAQLDTVRDNMSAHYILMNDIDLTDYLSEGGAGWEPIGIYVADEHPDNDPFTGSFDGNGHTINGLFIDRPDESGMGL